MIEELRITNLGVIAAARVPLAPGLTVITGETGAGKTMVLTGLGLILGGKADNGVVRNGADQASAEGWFALPGDSPVVARALEAGALLDDGCLVASRTVAAAGRSRAFLGGRGVPAAVLAEVAAELVTVHGQADQARLRSPRRQREALDAFAGPAHAATLAAYRSAWARRRDLRAELEELRSRAAELDREAELLRLGLAEVERVAPQPGEDLALAATAERLGHAAELTAAADAAHRALVGVDEPGPEPVVHLVEAARRALDQAAEHDPQLAPLAARAAELGYLAADLGADLAAYGDRAAPGDPGRLDEVHRRRAELSALARSHGGGVDDVLAWAEQAGRRLVELDSRQDRTAGLVADLARVDSELSAAAEQLTTGRRAAADTLAREVTAELAGLAMAAASLQVRLVELDEPGPHGAQEVELLLVPHAGAPARPLGQGASGGELSRVMLAIEVALAAASPLETRPGTFVFDEVDAGVGGRAAVEVGRRLAELARQAQVVVVTHLAQVAACADQHLVVTKSQAGGVDVVTASDVRVVDGEDRVTELARMLSGSQDSAAARQHAAELLDRPDVGR